MAEINSVPTNSLSDREAKASNFLEKVKEEIEAVMHTNKSPHHEKETRGRKNDIDQSNSSGDVRAPNVFERVKEEIEAIAQSIHHKNESPTYATRDETSKEKPNQKGDHSSSPTVTESQGKERDILRRAKQELESIIHHEKSRKHHKETHGRSDDIDEDTPIDSVKGPNVFRRAKEEIEAIIESIHPKKENHD